MKSVLILNRCEEGSASQAIKINKKTYQMHLLGQNALKFAKPCLIDTILTLDTVDTFRWHDIAYNNQLRY